MDKRVCVIRQGYFPDDPRVRKQVLALLEEGHDVDVICMREADKPRREVWRGVNIYRLPLRHRRAGALAYVLEYMAFLLAASVCVTLLDLRRRFDVIQVNTLPDILVFSALVPKLRGAKVVVDFHELMPEMFAAEFTGPLVKVVTGLLRLFERAAAHYVDRVVIANPVQAEILSERAGIDSVAVILNVPQEGVFSPVTDGATTDGEVPRIMTHGTLVERYGVHVLIQAMPMVLSERAVNLEVIGGGEQLPRLLAMTEELGLEGAVSFTAWLTQAELAERLRHAAVGVVPIIRGYLETVVPNKLFDYVASGVPVVSSDTVGIRACFDERALAFAPPEDSASFARQILALLDNHERAEKLRSEALEVYQRLRWERTKADYTAVFRDLARDANSGSGRTSGAGRCR